MGVDLSCGGFGAAASSCANPALSSGHTARCRPRRQPGACRRWFGAGFAALLGLCGVSLAAACAAAEADVVPVPAITIYPGDAIRDEWLTERAFNSASAAHGQVILSREAIVGKVARRTLLPGAPIPQNAVSEPKVVKNGAKVRIVFEDGPLIITSYGAALQDGGIGDLISLRNIETGLTVSGTVQADGSVRLSGG